MKRTIIKIDENKCNGCGVCVEGCHEGALQLIDGKARMVSELYCDGLGACIGECPEGAIELIEAEALPYDETATIARIAPNGRGTVLAHLKHLADHDQKAYVQQAMTWLTANGYNIKPEEFAKQHQSSCGCSSVEEPVQATSFRPVAPAPQAPAHSHHGGGGCPGGAMRDFRAEPVSQAPAAPVASQLRQWPVQLHLLNPQAPYLQNSDLLLAADCVAFAMGNFHSEFLAGRSLAIACPKLDEGKDIYIEKLAAMIDLGRINTLTVMMMEVPCCGGLLQLAKMAVSQANRKVPVKKIIVSLRGEVLQEEWV